MNLKGTVPHDLAAPLVRRAEESSPDAYYRLARIVARVVRGLAARPEVEERLVRQAVLRLGKRGA